MLTTKKPCRLDASKSHLKTLHHASQAMAGAHIPSVKFNACICAWAGPSRALYPAKTKTKTYLKQRKMQLSFENLATSSTSKYLKPWKMQVV